MSVFMLQASQTALKQSGTPDKQLAPQHLVVALLDEPSRASLPGPPPFVGASTMFLPGTVPPDLNHL